MKKPEFKKRVLSVGEGQLLSVLFPAVSGQRFAVKHGANFACRGEKIFGKRQELKRKTILERKRYNSKMTSRIEIAL